MCLLHPSRLFTWLLLSYISGSVYVTALTTNPSQTTVDFSTGATDMTTNGGASTTNLIETTTPYDVTTVTDAITTTDVTPGVIENGTATNGVTDDVTNDVTTTAGVFTSTDGGDFSTTDNFVSTTDLETTTAVVNVTIDNGVGSTKRLTDSQIAVIISTTMCGLVFLLLLIAICSWLISKNRHRRSRRVRRRRSRRLLMPVEINPYSKHEAFSGQNEIYIPYDGPPEMTSPQEAPSIIEPYKSLPAPEVYSPYLFDDRAREYVRGEINPFNSNDWDRPYYSTIGIRNSFKPSSWYMSMPSVEINLPRPWIRY